MSSMREPEISIVIRAFNEERWLPSVLKSIAEQRYRDFEIVLVDSGSVDATREIGASYGARIIQLRTDDFTFGHSLNVGVRESRGRFIAILSAHAIPTDDQWLERLVEPLRDGKTAMVFGGQRGHAVSKFSEARDFERVFPDAPQWMDDEHVFVNNANSAIRRDLWEQHPFDEGLPGLEDAEWAKYWIYPHGMSVYYEPKACIYHVHTESWSQVRNRFHREGIAGRWIAVRIMRHIPGEITREILWSSLDLWQAARERRLRSLAGEIVRYRYHKTVGIVKGVLDSRTLENPSLRQELFLQHGFPAVVIKGPHHASLEQRSIPELKPSEILVRVAYEGICATDLEILEGRLGYYKSGLAKYPIVPGHESSGTVISIGKKVSSLHDGDRVVVECIQGCGVCAECKKDNAIACRERREVGVMGIDGGYSAYLVTRARYAHRVPDDVTLQQAALAEPLAVVIKGLCRLEMLAGSNGVANAKQCAVVGAGAIGHLAARVLAQRGHAVTVFDRDPTRLEWLRDVVNTSTAMSGFDAFDWIVEATGDQEALNGILHGSKTGAALLLLGFPYAPQSFSFESIVGFDKIVLGSVGSRGRDFDEALATLPKLDTSAFTRSTFLLEEYERAWSEVRSRKHLKVMLKIDPSAA